MPGDLSIVSLFFRGLILGFTIAAPVGPIGVLCIRRTLAQGRRVGLVSGLGAATADAIYGSIAAFGLTIIGNFLVQQQFWLTVIGGIFLGYLGIRTFFARPCIETNGPSSQGAFSAYGSTFLLTITNPMTILSFTAVYATIGLTVSGSTAWMAAMTVIGVFCGSALWWFVLSLGVSWFRRPLTVSLLAWINRGSGVILVGFALVMLIRLL